MWIELVSALLFVLLLLLFTGYSSDDCQLPLSQCREREREREREENPRLPPTKHNTTPPKKQRYNISFWTPPSTTTQEQQPPQTKTLCCSGTKKIYDCDGQDGFASCFSRCLCLFLVVVGASTYRVGTSRLRSF